MRFITSIKQSSSASLFVLFNLIIFLMPLIFSRDTNELYEFPKARFLIVSAILCLAVYSTTFIVRPKKLYKIPVYVWLFLASFIVSVVFSNHIYTSVAGYYTRFGDSLIILVSCFVLYTISLNVFSSEEKERLMYSAHLSSIILTLVALGQYFKPLNFLWGGQLQERVFSTLGQPNWLAQYLLFLLGYSIYEFVFKNNKKYFGFYIVQFLALWLTFSMSGLAGFMVMFLYFIFLALKNKETFIKVRKLFALLLGVSILVSLLIPGIFYGKLRDVWSDIKNTTSNQVISYADQGTVENEISDPGYIRLGLWKGTLDMIFSDPKIFFIGTGPETFPYYFQKYRPLSLNYSSEWNYVFNKPHNYYLETWAEQGLIGLISYLGLIYFAIRKLEPKYRSGIIAFSVSNFFGWSTIPVMLLFWIYLSCAKQETK